MSMFYKFLVTILLVASVLIRSNAQSQSQSTAPYIIVKTTYAFPASPQKINESVTTIKDKDFTQGIYGSYAHGINLNVGVGKMLNPTFGAELNAQILLGNTIKTTYDQFGISGSQSDRVRGLILKPLIVIRNSGDLLSIYTKLGLAIATVSNRFEQEDKRFVSDGQTYQIISEATETARAKVGFAACFGFAFRVSESLSLFVEANGQILSLPITKGHYTKFDENGVDKLPTMKTSDKSWVYEKSTVYDPNQTPDDSKPGVKLYNPAYFSYIGVGLGLMYHF